MKIVVIGGSGFIGSKLVNELRQLGHIVIATAQTSGVNKEMGRAINKVLEDTNVVIDVAHPPSIESQSELNIFQLSGHNRLAAEALAGVHHHITLSLVGVERMQGSGYFRAKAIQENIVKDSEIPYTILQSTQFFEMIRGIAQSATSGNEIHISNAKVQPVAADDVVSAIADITVSSPLNITVQIAGPDRFHLDELIRIFLNETNDPRKIVVDKHALYFGVELNDLSLIAEDDARVGKIRFIDWLRNQNKSNTGSALNP